MLKVHESADVCKSFKSPSSSVQFASKQSKCFLI